MNGGQLSNKRALVTGATRGIGQAVALAYAREGAELMLSGRDASRLEASSSAARDHGATVHSLTADLATASGVEALVAATLEAFHGELDVLVHCAGAFTAPARLVDTTPADWQATLAVNLSAAHGLVRGLYPALTRAPSASIVLVSSGLGVRARPELGAYVVSKFGLEGFHQTLTAELEGGTVRANLVLPGRVHTDMHLRAFPGADPDSLAAPQEVTPVFVHLASDASRGTHGARLDAHGWTT